MTKLLNKLAADALRRGLPSTSGHKNLTVATHIREGAGFKSPASRFAKLVKEFKPPQDKTIPKQQTTNSTTGTVFETEAPTFPEVETKSTGDVPMEVWSDFAARFKQYDLDPWRVVTYRTLWRGVEVQLTCVHFPKILLFQRTLIRRSLGSFSHGDVANILTPLWAAEMMRVQFDVKKIQRSLIQERMVWYEGKTLSEASRKQSE